MSVSINIAISSIVSMLDYKVVKSDTLSAFLAPLKKEKKIPSS